MFNLFKKKDCVLYAPVNGKSIPLENVPDKVFANKLIGDGVGFVFEEDTVYAPCDGEILMIANTNHAFGIKAKNNLEVLVHVGLETVNLNGEGLSVLVKQGQKVKAHDPIIKINREMMKEKNIDLTTPMIITNLDNYEIVITEPKDVTVNSITIETKIK